MKWKHFPRYWSFVRGIHRWPVNSPQKGQWRGTLMFSLICTWINGWVNNDEADDLGRHRTHYDVIVMVHNFPQQNIVCRMSAFMFRPQGVNTPRGTDTRNTGPCPTCHLDTTCAVSIFVWAVSSWKRPVTMTTDHRWYLIIVCSWEMCIGIMMLDVAYFAQIARFSVDDRPIARQIMTEILDVMLMS